MPRRVRRFRLLLALSLLGLVPPAAGGSAVVAERADVGVLVMAHGGDAEWNAAVERAVEPLAAERPVEIAFGMADACTLRAAIARLEARGARRIVVTRLFASGESWRERTEKILGLRPGAPEPLRGGGDPCAGDHGAHTHHDPASMPWFRVDSQAAFALTAEGLLDAPETGAILAERARTLSRDPEREEVLVLAHGPADDAEDARWLAALDARAEAVRAALPFHSVRVRTLREDWPEKRRAAEADLRATIERASSAGRATIVLPFRLHGFGPYERVLEGRSYVADGRGLLPHVGVTAWLRRQVEALASGPFASSPRAAAAP